MIDTINELFKMKSRNQRGKRASLTSFWCVEDCHFGTLAISPYPYCFAMRRNIRLVMLIPTHFGISTRLKLLSVDCVMVQHATRGWKLTRLMRRASV